MENLEMKYQLSVIENIELKQEIDRNKIRMVGYELMINHLKDQVQDLKEQLIGAGGVHTRL